jgi:hypothetical protein
LKNDGWHNKGTLGRKQYFRFNSTEMVFPVSHAAYFCTMRMLLFRQFLLFMFLMLLSGNHGHAQEIVINEYYNSSSQNDEWTELVVVKDDLDLRGWFLGDNNAATNSWQPKIQFNPSNSFWNHLRAGTIIVLDHASGTDESNCNDAQKYDYDKSDGFIRICVRNPDYFLGGSTTTLFLADGGDFVQIVNPSGKMVHGIGHDANPGGSVLGTPCFASSANWNDMNSANGDTPPCPNGPFTYYRFGMSAPTSLKMICGDLPQFSSGMQEAGTNPVIDTTDTAFEGIGNGTENNNWLIELRAPEMEAQTICPVKLPTGAISLTWNSISDPLPTDQTCGYMVVRNSSGDFGLPPQGKEFAAGSSYGIGSQMVTVAAILDHTGAATSTYTETGAGNFFYRIFPFRYKNTPGFEHPSRGRTYNTTQFVKVNAGDFPPIPVINDTLCAPGLATLIVPPIPLPGPGGIAWYQTPTGGSPILINQDTLRFAVSQTTSFWVEFGNNAWCNSQRIEVKALVQPLECPYTSPDSICEGVPAILSAAAADGLSYKWTPLSVPSTVRYGSTDSSTFEISTAATSRKEWMVFRMECLRKDGCKSAPVTDSIFTIPFECSLYSVPENPLPGQAVQVKVQSNRSSFMVSKWSIKNADILEEGPVSCWLQSRESRPMAEAVIEILNELDKPVCKAIRSLPAGMANLLLGKGSPENQKLTFNQKLPESLRIYNRWGQRVAEFPNGYQNNWPETAPEAGVYFWEAEFSNPKQNLHGWLEFRP